MHRPHDPPADQQRAASDDERTERINVGEAAEVVEALLPSQLVEVLRRYTEALHDRRKGIDQLNVYPVPDGDTGTNMTLTMQSVLAELKDATNDDMHAFATALSRGAIMGARGNSGAILAQAFRGFAESIREKSAVGPKDLADAFESARNAAYTSVLKPVEGTILTVVTAASEAAKRSAAEGKRLVDQIQDVSVDAAEALRRTPDLLPVLKQAGVVDAGGTGFIPLLEAMRSVVTGEPMTAYTGDAGAVVADFAGLSQQSHGDGASELSDLRYEVMFLLKDADDTRMSEFREGWGACGDSIVVVGGDGLWNCHIHGDDIGAMIEFSLDFGRPSSIRVTDLLEQTHTHLGHETVAQGSVGDDAANTAVVAVVAGEGLRKAFLSSGASGVVAGGQSMNPSVRELVDAVEAAPSLTVILLPNNRNIIAAANQVNALTSKTVDVIPTVNPAQGLSLLIHFDPWADADEVIGRLREEVGGVLFGSITQAVRDASTDLGEVKEGQWMGFVNDKLRSLQDDAGAALRAVGDGLLENHPEILTVIQGENASESVLQEWLDEMDAGHPEVVIETMRGDQPLYPFYLSAE